MEKARESMQGVEDTPLVSTVYVKPTTHTALGTRTAYACGNSQDPVRWGLTYPDIPHHRVLLL